jgi:hypothetical protein
MMTRRLSKRHSDLRQMAFEKLRTIVRTAIPSCGLTNYLGSGALLVKMTENH